MLRAQGWLGIVLETDPARRDLMANVRVAPGSLHNLTSVLRQYAVPSTFDHLSVVASPNSWWLLHAVLQLGFRPRSVTAHFNQHIPPSEAIVAEYNLTSVRNGTVHYGSSLYALKRLLYTFDYRIVAIDSSGSGVYAVLVNETGVGACPLSYEEVLAAHRNTSRICWAGQHAVEKGWRWVRLPEDLDLASPFHDNWKLQFITMAKEQSPDREGSVQVFQAFNWQDANRSVSEQAPFGQFELKCIV
jgi:hypothetical protein